MRAALNRSGRQVKGLSELPDILSPVILQFGSHIGDGNLSVEISLISRRHFVSYTLPLINRYIFILIKAWS
jgi:hypothetical protein